MAIESPTEGLVLSSRKRGRSKSNSRAIESEADLDVDLTVSCSSAPASQSARPRRQACFNYIYYASDSDASSEHLSSSDSASGGHSCSEDNSSSGFDSSDCSRRRPPFQIRCLMIYTDQPRLKSMIPNIPHYEFIIIL